MSAIPYSQNCISKVSRRDVVFIMIIAFVVVTLFSTSSFLYRFNYWEDANCIFTVGKSIFYGKVPYRDLIDHKGFLLHFINGIGSLISFRSFFGVYIMELIGGFFFLLGSYKTLLLFASRRVMYMMPFFALFVYSLPCFKYGASAEEFCLPFLSFSFYIGLKAVKNQERLTLKEAFLLGVFASCVFWIKYTDCGLYAGLGIGIIISYFQNGYQKHLPKAIALFFLGLVPVTATILLYYAFNRALFDLWMVYFYHNLFNYTITTAGHTLIVRLLINQYIGAMQIFNNPMMLCMLIGSLIALIIRKDKKTLGFCLICFISMFVVIFIGQSYPYYPLPFAVGMPFSLLLVKYLRKWESLKRAKVLYCISLVLTIVLCAGLRTTTRGLLYSDENHLALAIGKQIMNGKDAHPSILEYKVMDVGVYTVCGYVPECKNFCHINLKLKEQQETQENYIKTKHPTYIISKGPLTYKDYESVPYQFIHPSKSRRDIMHKYFPFIKPLKEKTKNDIYLYHYNKQTTP